MLETTLAIIKPIAVAQQHTGAILAQIQKEGFVLRSMEYRALTLGEAKAFYQVHQERPFYEEICEYISSDKVVIMLLEKEHAVADFRKLIGVTDPAQAAQGTIRKRFGTSLGHNAIHGSDALETAAKERAFFFPERLFA